VERIDGLVKALGKLEKRMSMVQWVHQHPLGIRGKYT
jgi:hypothetical protein